MKCAQEKYTLHQMNTQVLRKDVCRKPLDKLILSLSPFKCNTIVHLAPSWICKERRETKAMLQLFTRFHWWQLNFAPFFSFHSLFASRRMLPLPFSISVSPCVPSRSPWLTWLSGVTTRHTLLFIPPSPPPSYTQWEREKEIIQQRIVFHC